MLRLPNARNKYQTRSNVDVKFDRNLLSATWLLLASRLAVRSGYWVAVRSKVIPANSAYCI